MMGCQRTTVSLSERTFMSLQHLGASAVTAADACQKARADSPPPGPGQAPPLGPTMVALTLVARSRRCRLKQV
jgi:hypothetical protein